MKNFLRYILGDITRTTIFLSSLFALYWAVAQLTIEQDNLQNSTTIDSSLNEQQETQYWEDVMKQEEVERSPASDTTHQISITELSHKVEQEKINSADNSIPRLNSPSSIPDQDTNKETSIPLNTASTIITEPYQPNTPPSSISQSKHINRDDNISPTLNSSLIYGIASNTNTNSQTVDDNNEDISQTTSNSSSSSTSYTITVAANVSSGSYSKPLDITLTSSDSAATIFYCLDTTCCDPLGSNGVEYTGTFKIGEASDGDYCLSVQAVSNSSSDVVEYQYLINTGLPDVSQNIDVVQIQTNERSLLEVSSSDMGTDGFYLTQLNIGSNDPTGSTCEELLNSYPASSYGLLEENLNTSEIDMGGGRSPASIFSFPLNSNNVYYGDNYLVTIVEDATNSDGSLYSCPAKKVILKDFEIYSVVNGIYDQSVQGSDNSTLIVGFVGYGGFGTLNNTAYEGRASATNNKYLETGFLNIIN